MKHVDVSYLNEACYLLHLHTRVYRTKSYARLEEKHEEIEQLIPSQVREGGDPAAPCCTARPDGQRVSEPAIIQPPFSSLHGSAILSIPAAPVRPHPRHPAGPSRVTGAPWRAACGAGKEERARQGRRPPVMPPTFTFSKL